MPDRTEPPVVRRRQSVQGGKEFVNGHMIVFDKRVPPPKCRVFNTIESCMDASESELARTLVHCGVKVGPDVHRKRLCRRLFKYTNKLNAFLDRLTTVDRVGQSATNLLITAGNSDLVQGLVEQKSGFEKGLWDWDKSTFDDLFRVVGHVHPSPSPLKSKIAKLQAYIAAVRYTSGTTSDKMRARLFMLMMSTWGRMCQTVFGTMAAFARAYAIKVCKPGVDTKPVQALMLSLGVLNHLRQNLRLLQYSDFADIVRGRAVDDKPDNLPITCSYRRYDHNFMVNIALDQPCNCQCSVYMALAVLEEYGLGAYAGTCTSPNHVQLVVLNKPSNKTEMVDRLNVMALLEGTDEDGSYIRGVRGPMLLGKLNESKDATELKEILAVGIDQDVVSIEGCQPYTSAAGLLAMYWTELFPIVDLQRPLYPTTADVLTSNLMKSQPKWAMDPSSEEFVRLFAHKDKVMKPAKFAMRLRAIRAAQRTTKPVSTEKLDAYDALTHQAALLDVEIERALASGDWDGYDKAAARQNALYTERSQVFQQ